MLVIKNWKTYLYFEPQENAEVAVKDMLKEIAIKTRSRTGKTELYAEDFMDHGTKICLRIDINAAEVRQSSSFSVVSL